MNRNELLEQSILQIEEYARYGSKPGLERVRELLRRLGDPHKDLNAIHVGGTNGKGSVCRYVYSVLQKAGLRCGLTISPFIEEFTERIEFDGERISAEDLYDLTQIVTAAAEDMVREGLESPTEFELITAIAFLYFHRKQADIVILEVGLGGRGDATNVVDQPLAVCIASVSMDHMDYLGNTIEEIAWEKAGILKSGCPFVYASEDPAVIRVLEEQGRILQAPSYPIKKEMAQIREETPEQEVFDAQVGDRKWQGLVTGMPGRHQVMNALCALQVLELLRQNQGFEIPEEAIREGLANARQPGRIEILKEDPYVVLDGSHNADSVKALCRWIRQTFLPEDRLLVVTGVLKDKEYEKIADMLCEVASDFIVTEPDSPRRLSAEEYARVIRQRMKAGGRIRICPGPRQAAETAFGETHKVSEKNPIKGLIFTGSLYMIGEVRRTIRTWLS